MLPKKIGGKVTVEGTKNKNAASLRTIKKEPDYKKVSMFLAGLVILCSILIIVISSITTKTNSQCLTNMLTPPNLGKTKIFPPVLTDNPGLDAVVNANNPTLSFYNARGGEGNLIYKIQLDTSENFSSPDLIEIDNVKQLNDCITQKTLSEPNTLKDKTLYYWRVKANDGFNNESEWVEGKFYVDITPINNNALSTSTDSKL